MASRRLRVRRSKEPVYNLAMYFQLYRDTSIAVKLTQLTPQHTRWVFCTDTAVSRVRAPRQHIAVSAPLKTKYYDNHTRYVQKLQARPTFFFGNVPFFILSYFISLVHLLHVPVRLWLVSLAWRCVPWISGVVVRSVMMQRLTTSSLIFFFLC